MPDPRYDVYGVGHALVDVQYTVEPAFLAKMGIDKGVMTLVDQERQTQLSAALRQEPMARCSGGSAANTMIGVSAFGGSACYACRVGDDQAGQFYLDDLAAAGVHAGPDSRVAGPTGQCTVFITPDADRTLNTFLGVGTTLSPEQISAAAIQVSQYVYLEGYLVGSENGLAACRTAQRLAQTSGVRVSLTLSDPFVVTSARQRFGELMGAGVDLLFCNKDEAMAFTQLGDSEAAAALLAEKASMVCVTCGAEGALLYHDQQRCHVPAVPVRAVDTTGAGDLFAGGVLYGITHGHTLAQAGTLGAFAASQIVARYGSRLDHSLSTKIETILRGH